MSDRIRPMIVCVAATMQMMGLSATIACSSTQMGPSSEVGTRDQLLAALRAKSLNVSVTGETSAATNRYFSVSSTDVIVGNDLLKVFQYSTADEATAEASLISSEGQPNPRTAIGWISKPHFYKHGQIIVLYLGCNTEVVKILNEVLGNAVASGPGCNNP